MSSGLCGQTTGWRINNIEILQHKYKVQSLEYIFVVFRDYQIKAICKQTDRKANKFELWSVFFCKGK